MCSMASGAMKIALIYNLRPAPATPAWPDDLYAEWDEPETIAAVRAALATAHTVVLIENNSEVEAGLRASAPDIVFNMAEGLSGPDREAHSPALECWGIPFTGSSARTLHVSGQGSHQTCCSSTDSRHPPMPCFPVPIDSQSCRLSTIETFGEARLEGIEQASVVHTSAALQARVAYVLATYRQPALVEAFVPGREFTVALLGNGAEVTVLPLVICFAALPPGALPSTPMLRSGSGIPQSTLDLLHCPMDLPAELARRITDLCRRAFLALECHDWCRIDIRLDTHNHRSWS